MRIHDPIYISVPWQQHAIGRYLTQEYDDFVNHINELGDLMKKNWALLSKTFQKGKIHIFQNLYSSTWMGTS